MNFSGLLVNFLIIFLLNFVRPITTPFSRWHPNNCIQNPRSTLCLYNSPQDWGYKKTPKPGGSLQHFSKSSFMISTQSKPAVHFDQAEEQLVFNKSPCQEPILVASEVFASSIKLARTTYAVSVAYPLPFLPLVPPVLSLPFQRKIINCSSFPTCSSCFVSLHL